MVRTRKAFCLPEDVVVASRVVAAGVDVQLVGAHVVLDDVTVGTLLDVDAFVGACVDDIPSDQVVGAKVLLPVRPLDI